MNTWNGSEVRMPRELQHMSTEELKALRDQLKRRAQAKKKATPAPLHPHVTTDDVLRVIGQATFHRI
jgi:hypothetical protein